MSAVLVLNAGYEPLHKVSLRHAIKMLHRQVAVIEEAIDGQSFGPYRVPRVLRLVRYVAMRWAQREPAFSKVGVKRRDGKCAYCLGRPETIDHIIPASRGGELSWLNTVAACKKCNNKKANRTPTEARMKLLIRPTIPTYGVGLTYTPTWVTAT